MKTMHIILATAAIAAGCSEVTTPYPVGAPVTHEEAEAFEGAWHADEDVLHLHHIGAGRLVMAHLQWKAGEGRFELLQDTVVLGRIGEAMVLNLPREHAPGWYQFVLVRLVEEGHLHFWLANVEAYVDAVVGGRVEGTVERVTEEARKVRITSSKPAFDAFLAEQPLGTMFEMEDPAVLRRVRDGPE